MQYESKLKARRKRKKGFYYLSFDIISEQKN